jgi:hypothetical protein
MAEETGYQSNDDEVGMNNTKAGVADIHIRFRKIFKASKKPLKAWHIQAIYHRQYGKRYSESSVTARLREMMDVNCNLSDYTYDITQ